MLSNASCAEVQHLWTSIGVDSRKSGRADGFKGSSEQLRNFQLMQFCSADTWSDFLGKTTCQHELLQRSVHGAKIGGQNHFNAAPQV